MNKSALTNGRGFPYDNYVTSTVFLTLKIN